MSGDKLGRIDIDGMVPFAQTNYSKIFVKIAQAYIYSKNNDVFCESTGSNYYRIFIPSKEYELPKGIFLEDMSVTDLIKKLSEENVKKPSFKNIFLRFDLGNGEKDVGAFFGN
jgi:hypothetical protein